jgi:Translin-associated factor X-interacting N-terminus
MDPHVEEFTSPRRRSPERHRGSWLIGAKQALSKSLADVASENGQRLPKPPDTRKPTSSAIPSVITFERYNMMRPALLEDLKMMLSRGLESIQNEKSKRKNQNDEMHVKLQTLQLHKEVFQKFIDECNIYRPVLSSIKYEYDKMLDFYATGFGSVTSLHSQLVQKDEFLANETKRMNELHAEQMKSLVEQRLIAQKGKSLISFPTPDENKLISPESL